MPRGLREKLLPERNICSLYPSKDSRDAFSTGDGYQHVELLGDPYQELLTFYQEALYEPLYTATFMAGAWASGWVLKNQKKTNGMWGVAKMPDKVGVNNGGSFLAIPGGAKKKDQAWKFIKFACATVDAQNKMYRSEGIFPAYKPDL
jgi:ABC-type glycerol-3-phosphate transport system substrate-binding protein